VGVIADTPCFHLTARARREEESRAGSFTMGKNLRRGNRRLRPRHSDVGRKRTDEGDSQDTALIMTRVKWRGHAGQQQTPTDMIFDVPTLVVHEFSKVPMTARSGETHHHRHSLGMAVERTPPSPWLSRVTLTRSRSKRWTCCAIR